MRCPHCGFNGDKVIESRSVKDGEAIRRRRECADCGKRFTTYEEVVKTDVFVIKNDGRREEFRPATIRRGIELACWKRHLRSEDLDRMQYEVVRKVTENYESEVSTSQIGEVVMQVLKKYDEVAYIRFASVYRQFTDAEEFIDQVKQVSIENDSENDKL